MVHTIKFWNENRWNTFDAFGDAHYRDAERIAMRLSLLFSAVEIWSENRAGTGLVTITKIGV